MSPEVGKDQQAYVRDIIDSAKQAVAYTHGLTFEQFWDDHKTRDAVAMRLHIIGESAQKLKAETAAQLHILRVDDIRGMRNRIAHDYGRVNFRIVWKTVRENLPPLISELEKYIQQHELAQKIRAASSVTISPPRPSNGPRMGM